MELHDTYLNWKAHFVSHIEWSYLTVMSSFCIHNQPMIAVKIFTIILLCKTLKIKMYCTMPKFRQTEFSSSLHSWCMHYPVCKLYNKVHNQKEAINRIHLFLHKKLLVLDQCMITCALYAYDTLRWNTCTNNSNMYYESAGTTI